LPLQITGIINLIIGGGGFDSRRLHLIDLKPSLSKLRTI
jgi:hypothetical protein